MKINLNVCTVLAAFLAVAAHAEGSFNQGVTLLRQEAQKMSQKHRPMTIDQGLSALKANADFAPLFRHYTLLKLA